MNINFNSGFNKVPVGQQGTRKVKEERNAEVTGQSVEPAVVSGETVPEMAPKTTKSSSKTYIDGDMTVTQFDFWEESNGDNPNSIGTSDILKVNKMNNINI